jgi:hypothetical protein
VNDAYCWGEENENGNSVLGYPNKSWNTKITHLFSWFAICSRSATMVVCGSAGGLEDVVDTVDVVDSFFFPKRLLNMVEVMQQSYGRREQLRSRESARALFCAFSFCRFFFDKTPRRRIHAENVPGDIEKIADRQDSPVLRQVVC